MGRIVVVAMLLLSTAAWGGETVTRQDADACEGDTHRLCEQDFPDAKRVGECLVVKRAELSVACAQALARPRDGGDDDETD